MNGRLGYATEHLSNVIVTLTTGKGRIKERLEEAMSYWVRVLEEPLRETQDETILGLFEEIDTALTPKPIDNQQGMPSIIAVRAMSEDDAKHVASRLLYLYDLVQEIRK